MARTVLRTDISVRSLEIAVNPESVRSQHSAIASVWARMKIAELDERSQRAASGRERSSRWTSAQEVVDALGELTDGYHAIIVCIRSCTTGIRG